MSPELTAALAYYREWLKARKREQEAARWMRNTRDGLTEPDCWEYDRLIQAIEAEFEE